MKMESSSGWEQPWSLQGSLDFLRTTALLLTEGIPCLADLAALVKSDDFVGLASYKLDYKQGWDVFHLIKARQVLALYQKNDSLPGFPDGDAVAFEKWVRAEDQCKLSNAKFRDFLEGRKAFEPDVVLAFERARRKIRRILGRCPEIGELKLRFGPGATTTVKKQDSSPCNKMADGLSCSPGLFASTYFHPLLEEIPHWVDALGLITEHVSVEDVRLKNVRLAFVPKKAGESRIVRPEATLDSFVQLALGEYIAKRLRLAGVDLRDQSRNQQLARVGSLSKEFATLDLSSASDTICIELVRFLLPEEWFDLLNACRSKAVFIDGRRHKLQQFSGMGNGFTFPLESLIFFALASDGGFASVYGDDIVIDNDREGWVTTLLTAAGFTINTGKSFSGDVPFRESCGADYYKGINIRPFYQRTFVSNATLYSFHNFLYNLGDTEMCAFVKGFIPRHMRIYGPAGYGDGHLHAETYPDYTGRKERKSGWSGVTFETFAGVKRTQVSFYPGDWVSPLYSVYVNTGEPLYPSSVQRKLKLMHEHVLGCRSDLPDPIFREETEMVETRVRKSMDSMSCDLVAWRRPKWTLPGTEGFKRMKIYTLS